MELKKNHFGKDELRERNIMIDLKTSYKFMGLPRWHSGKVSACLSRRLKRSGFYPWVGS